MTVNFPALLTCPFCGSEPRYVYRRQFKEWFVSCSKPTCACKVGWTPEGKYAAMSQEDASTRWNNFTTRQWIDKPEIIQS